MIHATLQLLLYALLAGLSGLAFAAVGVMTRAQLWVARRQPEVKIYAFLVLAGVLILDAIILLL